MPMGAIDRAALLGFALACSLVPSHASSAAPRVPKINPDAKMPPLPPAVIDETLAIGGDDIDARKVRTRMTVQVRVNGQGPYRFVVDSGADSSVIGVRAARALQLPAGTPVLLNGMTDSSQVDRVLVDTIQLGPSTIRDLELPVLKDQNVGGEGMLGIDVLVQQRLMLDFEKRTINVEDARVPAKRLDGEIVVTARLQHGQLILTQAKANGRPIDAVIDTGSELSIGNLALRDRLMRKDPSKFTKIGITGVTGVPVDLDLARVDEVRLGSVVLHDVPIAFADVPPFAVFGLLAQPSLLVGTDLLETFRRVSLDFRARKVRFQLRRCGNANIILSTSFDSMTTRLRSDGIAACSR
jgi:hypothetical protein